LDGLQGVGDASLGEWHEFTGKAYHIRRRLDKGEELIIGSPVDLRQTDEATRRLRAMQPFANRILEELAMQEMKSPRICEI
jgi:hypothetical protein